MLWAIDVEVSGLILVEPTFKTNNCRLVCVLINGPDVNFDLLTVQEIT